MTSLLKVFAASAALLAALLMLAPARPAAAATPCWKTLLNDWYDGRIDNIYPVHCYQDAIRHLPPDISVYSSAKDDILRALQSAQAQLKVKKVKVTRNTPVPAETTSASPPVTTTVSDATRTTATTTAATTTTAAGASGPSGTDAGGGTSNGSGTPGRKQGKGLPGVAQQLNPSSPSSVPVPLLVLGGLAILLVAAGAGGLVLKRMQSRRQTG